MLPRLCSAALSLLVLLTAHPLGAAGAPRFGDATGTAPPVHAPAPECRGARDDRRSKRTPFVVCGLVVVSKNHRVTADYAPELSVVPLRRTGRDPARLDPVTGDALGAMFAAAGRAGHQLAISSAYRSYATQRSLYSGDPRTAPAGASEHQTGLAVDLAAIRGGRQVRGPAFGRSEAGAWVRRNAVRFGFILRYPNHKQAITRIPYEPWHFRYVGRVAAEGAARAGTLERYLRIS